MLSKPEDDRYRPKHVVFYCRQTPLFSHIFIVVFLTEFTSPYSHRIKFGRRG